MESGALPRAASDRCQPGQSEAGQQLAAGAERRKFAPSKEKGPPRRYATEATSTGLSFEGVQRHVASSKFAGCSQE